MRLQITDKDVQLSLKVVYANLQAARKSGGSMDSPHFYFADTSALRDSLDCLCDVWRVQNGHTPSEPEGLDIEDDGSLDDLPTLGRHI